MEAVGVRRLYALVCMLPADSALATIFRTEEPEPTNTQGPSSWSDLAKALTASTKTTKMKGR